MNQYENINKMRDSEHHMQYVLRATSQYVSTYNVEITKK